MHHRKKTCNPNNSAAEGLLASEGRKVKLLERDVKIRDLKIVERVNADGMNHHSNRPNVLEDSWWGVGCDSSPAVISRWSKLVWSLHRF